MGVPYTTTFCMFVPCAMCSMDERRTAVFCMRGWSAETVVRSEGDRPMNVNDLLLAMEKLNMFNPALNALKTQKVGTPPQLRVGT